MIAPSAPFDRIARSYQRLWDGSDAGSLQRTAVWRYLQPVVKAGDRVLDVGCGTGEDALRLANFGAAAIGIDASAEMVRIARARGVDAHVRRVEDLAGLHEKFDGIISIFGPLNCIQDLASVRQSAAAMTDTGGYLVVCVMGRFCLTETLWYLTRGALDKSTRRWRGWASSSLGLKIYYPSTRKLVKAFSPAFRLEHWAGIGIFVPPSFVRGVSADWARRLDRIDRRVASLPFFRAIGDHSLLVFRRV